MLFVQEKSDTVSHHLTHFNLLSCKNSPAAPFLSTQPSMDTKKPKTTAEQFAVCEAQVYEGDAIYR